MKVRQAERNNKVEMVRGGHMEDGGRDEGEEKAGGRRGRKKIEKEDEALTGK